MSNVTDTFYRGSGYTGYGAQLMVGLDNGSPETFVAVFGVMSIKPGKLTTGVISKMHLRSIGRAEEKLATTRDYEPFTVRMQWNPTHGSQSQAGGDGFTGGGLLALHAAATERNMKIVTAIGSPALEWPFAGVVTGYDVGEMNKDGLIDLTVEITPLFDFTADLP